MSRLIQFSKAKLLIITVMLLLTALAAIWMLWPKDADQHDDATAIAVQADDMTLRKATAWMAKQSRRMLKKV